MNALHGLVCVLATCGLALADSVYQTQLDDPNAVYLTAEAFGVAGDGEADDAPGLQAAIDAVAAKGYPGVLFVPEGRYRLGETVYVWPGVRLIGYGKQRPVFVLGSETPGFQEGDDCYMLYFSGGRGREPGDPPRDGSPGTFYSAMSNIDMRIEPGNPAAVAVRFHVAQHCYLSHMRFELADARAGLEDIGNLVEDLHFVGGRNGIVTARSAPGWPIVVMDCTFEGQTESAITCDEAGLAVIRPTIRGTRVGIEMVEGKPDELWVSDGVFEDVTDAGVVISREAGSRTQVNLENVVCRGVPVLARMRESGDTTEAPGSVYRVDRFSHGLHLEAMGARRGIRTVAELTPQDDLPAKIETDIPVLPPTDNWVNVRTLGVVGDGQADDTEALQRAIDSHDVLYLPIGVYRVSDSLKLREESVLVGLQPGSTALYLANQTPGFDDHDVPRPVLESSKGGRNIVRGIGVYTGSVNPGAVGVRWTAGERSMVDDVRLHGGHGTRLSGGIHDSRGRVDREHWDRQHASLWVTDGGGGVIKNIWTPSPYADAGLKISDTSTPGRLYAMSAEHHVSHEVVIHNAANWRIFGLQFEAEREESGHALPMLIEDSKNLLFANTFFYRVVSSFEPFNSAVAVSGSEGIRFRNVHVYSNSKVSYDSAVRHRDSGAEVRDPEFAVLDITAGDAAGGDKRERPFLADTSVELLADGFRNISGSAVDAAGDLYFADPRVLTVYKWSVGEGALSTVRVVPQRPEQLAFDQVGNLLVVAYDGDGTVLAFNLNDSDGEVRTIKPQPTEARPGGVAVLPVNRWMGVDDFMEGSTESKPYHYVAPDGVTFIPAGEDFVTGQTQWGTKLTDVLRAFGMAPAKPGSRFYVTNEHELRTWSFLVGDDGTLTDPRLFVEEGGEGVAVDHEGRVYIAAGHVRVFDLQGKSLGVIRMPQRPTSLVFGGPDGQTLFITARSSLYAVRVR